MAERLKILLSGMVAGDPGQGGASWAVLQYVAGFEDLGHEVMLVEPVKPAALDPAGTVADYFRSLPLLDGRAALLGEGTEHTLGLPYSSVLQFADEADLLLNISGMLRDERLLERIQVRAFLDLDPGFNQVWQETGEDMGIDRHTHCVTVGGLIGNPDCPIPTLSREWIPTLPPVALEHWGVADPSPRRKAFTSVGNWRSYGSIEHQGIHYGQRAHSLRRLIELPRRTGSRFELALGIHPDETVDLEQLRNNDWVLLDTQVAATPDSYLSFVGESRAELCVAKSGYVASGSGWFSDRSACYLARGRPVVAQDTGFTRLLPTGEGLLGFSTVGDAAEAIFALESDWRLHRVAARQLAEEYLNSKIVLPRLIETLLV